MNIHDDDKIMLELLQLEKKTHFIPKSILCSLSLSVWITKEINIAVLHLLPLQDCTHNIFLKLLLESQMDSKPFSLDLIKPTQWKKK